MSPTAELPPEWQELDRKCREKRRRWARAIGRPYSIDLDSPEPGELPIIDSEEG